MDNYRHALAHRIPLYIPPYTLHPDREAEYKGLEDAKWQALVSCDIVKHEQLKASQEKMHVFRPWMLHSFQEQAKPIPFHMQLLINFNTIDELGQKLLQALDK